MRKHDPVYHAGEVIFGSNDGDSIGVGLDERDHSHLLITLTETNEHKSWLYVKPADARTFASALVLYAKAAEEK